MSKLIENMKLYRKKHRMTQAEVADCLGVQRSTYSRYEEGANRPSFHIIIKLADLYHISADELLGRVPAEEKSDMVFIDPKQLGDYGELLRLYFNAHEFAQNMAKVVLESGQKDEEASTKRGKKSNY